MTKSIESDRQIFRMGKVLRFFLLVYGLSLPLWVIQLFLKNNSLPLNIPITDIVAAFTPLIAACILTYKDNGKQGVLALLSRILDYKKLSKKWWLVIGIFPIMIFGLIYLTLHIIDYPLPAQSTISIYSLPLLLTFFFLGAVGEEVGYMGYAVDRLQNKFTAFWTSIIIGIPWIVWHYPSMIQQGHSLNFFFWGSLGTIAFRIIFVWLYNNSNKCLFSCIALHCLYNTGRVFFPSNSQNNPLVAQPMVHYSAIVLLAIIIIIIYGQKTLTHFVIKKIE